MRKFNFKTRETVAGLVDIQAESFAKAFPHLKPGVLLRPLSPRETTDRALLEMWNTARIALWSFHIYDESLAEEMVDRFVDRAINGSLLEKFKPGRGDIRAFIYGVMKRIALECFRERARRRIQSRSDLSQIFSREPDPSRNAEENERTAQLRRWVMKLTPPQRNAVARRIGALSDLDDGAAIRNERVTLHRATSRLRKMAGEFYAKKDNR